MAVALFRYLPVEQLKSSHQAKFAHRVLWLLLYGAQPKPHMAIKSAVPSTSPYEGQLRTSFGNKVTRVPPAWVLAFQLVPEGTPDTAQAATAEAGSLVFCTPAD